MLAPSATTYTPLASSVLASCSAELVLAGARQRDLSVLDRPGPLTGVEVAAEVLGVLRDPAASHLLEIDDPGQLLLVDAVGVVDEARRVRHGQDLAAQPDDVLGGVLRHVPGPGDQAGLAVDAVVAGLEHLVGEVHDAVAGRLGPDEAATPGWALAGEDTGELVGQPLVLAEQEADLAGADPDVAGGDVGAAADVAEQLAHERLAEPHDLAVAATLGVEVGPALAAARGAGW